MVKVVDSLEEFNAALDSKPVVIVDFFADWCGPCKMIAPKYEALSKEFTSILFLKVNVDDADEIASKYNVTAMPTFLVFKNGEKVDSLTGASGEKLEALARKYSS